MNVGSLPVYQRLSPDGKEQMLMGDVGEHLKDGLSITAFLQRVEFPASPPDCRKERWAQRKWPPGEQPTNVKFSEGEGFSRIDHDILEIQGHKVNVHSVHAYWGAGMVCAEVHLSKVNYRPKDDARLTAELDSVRFASDSTTESSSLDLLRTGSQLYLQHNYLAASNYYQQALNLEKEKPSLKDDYFKVLVDNLGMSYGLTGHLAEAKDTFEYGISQKPTYPLFYYNLACTYGEMGQRDAALEQLRKAYQYKTNMISGEKFPDPLRDSSFRAFASDRVFVDAIRAMQHN